MKVPQLKEFTENTTALAFILDKYITIQASVFFIKRINEFGDAVLMKDDSDGMKCIGNIFPSNKKTIYLSFKYNGISIKQKIKFSDIKTTK